MWEETNESIIAIILDRTKLCTVRKENKTKTNENMKWASKSFSIA